MFDDYRIKRNSTRINVEPEKLFEDWAFTIDKPQWGIFGVFYGAWLDTEKNDTLRKERTKELMDQGVLEKEAKSQATKEIQHKVYGWGVQKEIDPFDSFHEGYVFYRKDDRKMLQVVEEKSDEYFVVVGTYEAFYSTNSQNLALTLKTGNYGHMVKDSPLRMRETPLKYVINNHLNSLSNHAQQALLI